MKKFIVPFLFLLFLLVGYIPNFYAVDKNATQFFYLSILNTLSILILYLKRIELVYINRLGFLTFGSYIIWALFSYYYAFNKEEVIIYSNKMLVYFISFSCIYTLFKNSEFDYKKVVFIFFILTSIEIIWINNLFLERFNLIGRDLGLRAFTGNINITGIVLLFKAPIILYGIDKFRGIYKSILTINLIALLFTILLMGSRLSNLIILSTFIGFIAYKLVISSKIIKNSTLLILGISILISLTINKIIFQESPDNAISRTTNILESSGSTNQRLRFYGQAIDHILNNPFIGTGAGNWKIQSLIYENEFIKDYVVPFHVHNDYLQSAAELGVLGFLLNYIFYIIFIFLFVKEYKNILSSSKISFYFIVPIVIFLLDSFFNFPYDRPIVIIFNMVFLTLIFNSLKIKSKFFDDFKLSKKLALGLLILSFGSIFISKKVYDSFVDQNDLIVGMIQNSYYLTEAELYNIDSSFPSIGATTVPIDIYKANYLLNKDVNKDTIIDFIERGAKKNPYLYSQHALKSVYYLKQKNLDSSKLFAQKAFYGLSNNKTHFNLYTDILAALKDSIELKKAYSHLLKPPRKEFTEKYLRHLNSIKTNFDKDDSLLISELSDKNILSSFGEALNIINQVGKKNVFEGVELSLEAEKLFNEKKYSKAGELFLKASKLNPREIAYFENAANCFMKTGKNDRALEILLNVENNFETNGKTEYLLSIIYFENGNKDKSCFYINKSYKKGFKSDSAIYNLFCYDDK